ncbi:MAG: aromatic ring-hydroxylating dioxygenase subunit alpha [Pseudomonadota bacterium]
MADGAVARDIKQAASDVETLRTELAQIAGLPDDAPRGLSGQHYVDPAYFEHEWNTVLHNGWHCLARADEIPNSGDYLALKLLEEPIVLVRDGDTIRALSNVCQHRGMPLVQGTGRAKRFVCPYHAWAYRTDGRLMYATRMENEGFDPKSCGLTSFACVERFGFIYVSLSDAPSDLDLELGDLADHLAPYEPENYRIVHTANEVWQTNWKCLVENFMEGYHLSVVHPQTLHSYTPTELCKKGPNGPGYTSYISNYPDEIPSRGRGAPGLKDTQRHQSFLFAAFPCQVASIAPTLFVSLCLLPQTADRVDVRWTMSVYGDELDDDIISQRIALWTEVNREDREKLELMQKALGSRYAPSGPLAGPDFEGTIWDFVRWLARQDKTAP